MFRVRVGLVARLYVRWITADLGAGVSESARCALEPAEGQAFAAALVVDGRYLCALSVRCSWALACAADRRTVRWCSVCASA